jgi:hypothetical protein
MKTTKMLVILVLALGLMVCQVKISEAEPMGTAFTYNGRLEENNHPATGDYDFEFALFDDPNIFDGIQIGDTLFLDDVKVTGGSFHVELDFGSDPNVFNGDARWMEMAARDGDVNDPNAFTTLLPRMQMTAAPYALNTSKISGKELVDLLQKNEPNTVGESMIKQNSITKEKIGNGAISKEKIENSAVGKEKIENGAVGKEKIENGAVGKNKIENGAVGKEKIENGAVDPNKLASNAVAREKIQNGAINSSKLENGAVNKDKLGDISGYAINTSYLGNMIHLRNLTTAGPPKSPAIIKLEHFGYGGGLEAHAPGGTSLTMSAAAIEGTADVGVGVRGISSGGYTDNGIGVYGKNTNAGYGVFGESAVGGWAGYFQGRTMITDQLRIGGNATTDPFETLHVDGKVYVEEMDTATGGWGVRWENNRLVANNSSARYKDNIRPLQDDTEKILQAEPKSFTWKRTGRNGIGFIAEEFDTLGLKDLVTYDKDGRPDAVNYELVPLYLLQVLKDQVRATKQLRDENESLRERIEVLERAFGREKSLSVKEIAR